MAFDSKCHELAEYFAEIYSAKQINMLAQEIQDVIESWLEWNQPIGESK